MKKDFKYFLNKENYKLKKLIKRILDKMAY